MIEVNFAWHGKRTRYVSNKKVNPRVQGNAATSDLVLHVQNFSPCDGSLRLVICQFFSSCWMQHFRYVFWVSFASSYILRDKDHFAMIYIDNIFFCLFFFFKRKASTTQIALLKIFTDATKHPHSDKTKYNLLFDCHKISNNTHTAS